MAYNREVDALVSQYSHEKQRPREAEALEKLKKIASLVKPLMRARGWKVGTLSEFYPEQQNLLGMNKNRGQVIYLRLRYPGDADQFVPMEQVIDTMLHELSHNVWGAHDANFHKLWDELRDEYQGLVSKGYTGEGFLSEGHRLGGRRIPRDEALRIRRIAAETRAALTRGSGQKVGGAGVPRGSDMRKVIADAIERRSTITKGCASGGNKDVEEIESIGNQASKNGYKTKAEEDEANEAAIAQALWELHQEDEKEKLGKDYIPPTMASSSKQEPAVKNPPTSRPAPAFKPASTPTTRFDNKPLPSASRSSESSTHSQPSNPPPPRSRNLANKSRLVPPLPAKRRAPSSSPAKPKSFPDPTTPEEQNSVPTKFWTCPSCTFAENPLLHLCCDVCTAEQPDFVMIKTARPAAKPSPGPGVLGLRTWVCQRCSNEMENQWWTCSFCGTLKLNSKD